MALRPSNAPNDVFYLQPVRKVTPELWYQARPVGHNSLAKTVKKLCFEVGITGHFTNHSLRRTAVTRMFQKGVQEDKIMSITGHRSAKALRVYKEMNIEQEEEICDIIQPKRRQMMSMAIMIPKRRKKHQPSLSVIVV